MTDSEDAMYRACTGFLLLFAASLGPPVLANGVRPPRVSFAVDVTCTKGAIATQVPNARLEGIEPGKRTAQLRVTPAGALGDLLPLHLVQQLRFEREQKPDARGFVPAELRRSGSDAKERVRVQVRTAAGPVRLISYGSNAAVELSSCERLEVVRRPDADKASRGQEAKK